MCGLVGIAGDLALKDEATMKRLFLLDYFRGTDATGFAAIRKHEDEVKLVKVASHPLDLFDMARFRLALTGSSSKVFIGHNRAKTIGANTAVNAHPFEFGHIVGAHNGTLEKSSLRDLERMAEMEFEVDSQAVFYCIAKFGIEETIKVMEGAWALVWYDSQQGTLNFIRNEKRPLWYSYTENFKRIIWASEYLMIDNALKMAGVEKDYELATTDKGNCYFALPVNTLHSYKVADIIAGGKQPKPTAKKLEGRETPPIAVGSPFVGGVNGGTTRTTTQVRTQSTTTSRGPDKVKHFIGTPAAPFAGLVTQSEFAGSVAHGCSWCKAPINWGDKGLLYHESDGTVLCRDCNGGSMAFNKVYVKDIDILMKL